MLLPNEDRNLAFQIAQGVQRAVETLDRTYRAELERLSRLKGLSVEDSQDVVQETIIGAVSFIQKGRFRGESSLRTLLFSILRKKIVDYLRKKSTAESIPLEDAASEDSATLTRIEDIAGPLADPYTKLITEEALKALPEEHRLILLLNQMGGYTIEEISSIIRRSPGAVGRMLAEAKKMFRNKLRGSEEK